MDETSGAPKQSIFEIVTTTLLWPLLTTLAMCVWIAYITFYNSRVVGSILTWIINKVGGSRMGHLHIGSFSFSALSGKIMLRDVAYITEDYTFRCQDALIVLRWWRPYKPLPANSKDSAPTRLIVFLFGVEFHCYNRSALYSEMEKKFGLPSQMVPQPHEKMQTHQTSEGNLSTSQGTTSEPANQTNIWRDFFGIVKFEIISGRMVFGNPLVPTVLVVGVEELRGTYTTISPSTEYDLYMHDINCSVDELRIMLAPSKDYMGRVDNTTF